MTRFYLELTKQAGWAQTQVQLYHFRDHRQNEVDIVLERGDGRTTGIEIKASATIRQADFKPLVKLAEFAGKKFERGLLFYSGQEALPFRFGEHAFHALPIGSLVRT